MKAQKQEKSYRRKRKLSTYHIQIKQKKMPKEQEQELANIGTEVIKQGHYAVTITMAGGQGTRLGHKGPKGTYALDTVNGKNTYLK